MEMAKAQREQEALYHQNTTITTAEQRVNAYIPQDGVRQNLDDIFCLYTIFIYFF